MAPAREGSQEDAHVTGRTLFRVRVGGLYQIVQLGVIAEEGLVLLFLLVDEVLDVHVEAGRGDALGALRGLLALLKQQRQEWEEGVPAGDSESSGSLCRTPRGLAGPRSSERLQGCLESGEGSSEAATAGQLVSPRSWPLDSCPVLS